MISNRAVSRRVQHRAELQTEIRDGARTLFARDGYANFSMRKLAAVIGYSPAAIYLYYQSKEALFRVLVDESFERLHASLLALTAEPAGDPAERLKRGLRLYVEWGVSHPHDYQIAFHEPVLSNGPYRVHPAFDLLRSLVAECLPEGKARGKAVQRSSQAAWAAVHGITSLLILRPSFPWESKEAVVREVIESAVNGIAAAAPRRRRHAK